MHCHEVNLLTRILTAGVWIKGWHRCRLVPILCQIYRRRIKFRVPMPFIAPIQYSISVRIISVPNHFKIKLSNRDILYKSVKFVQLPIYFNLDLSIHVNVICMFRFKFTVLKCVRLNQRRCNHQQCETWCKVCLVSS